MTDNVYAPPRANLETQEGPQELWAMEFKRVRRLYNASLNVRALSFLYALGSFGILAGFSVMTFQSPDRRLFAFIMFGYGALSLVTCILNMLRLRVGRVLGIVTCVLYLASIPIGTIIGIIGIIAYVQGGRLFGPDRLLHKDIAEVYRQRKKTKT